MTGGELAGPLSACLVSLLLAAGTPLAGQQDAGTDAGSDEAALAGAALGLYSGAAVGALGALMPCNRTLLGPRCAAVGAAVGGVVGLLSGALIGLEASEPIRDRARGALYGTLVGGVAGILLQQGVRQYAWNDALLVAVFGGAMGAAPRGTLIGTGVGIVVGGVAWLASPRGGPQDMIMFTLLGSTLGALADWVEGAATARGHDGPRLVSSFSIRAG